MKHFSYFLSAIAALALWSCGMEAPIPEGGDTYKLDVTAVVEDEEPLQSKTYIDGRTIYWSSGEYLLLFFNDGHDKFVKSLDASAATNAGKTEATFSFTISADRVSSYTFGGLYPASAAVAQNNSTASSYKVNLPAMQHASAGQYDPSAYILVAKPRTGVVVPTNLTASYRKAVALNHLTLTGVSGQIQNVEITAPDKTLAGKRAIDLTTGVSGGMISGSESVNVSYASALPSGTADIWFTSWNCTIASGEQLKITLTTTSGIYSKTITASSGGISFLEGKLNNLKVSFSGVPASNPVLSDFARAFVSVLEVWKDNVTEGLKVANVTVKGHFIPANITISVGGVTYNKADMYDAALHGFVNLCNGGSLSGAIPSVLHKGWGDDPYNELNGNGGPFTPETVGLTLLRNYASRELSWISSHSLWANFCGYKGSADQNKGDPKISDVLGCCCLERNLLMLARFYEYLLENGISSDIMTKCSDMQIDAGLYDSNVSPIETGPTIADLAAQMTELLATWNSTTGTIDGVPGRHYIPDDATITIKGVTYTKAAALELALTAYGQLYNGTATTASPLPALRGFTYPNSPRTESTAFSESEVNVAFLNSAAVILNNYAESNGGAYPNYVTFPKSGYDSQSASASGQLCLDRALLTVARFYQYIQDEKIVSDIASRCAGARFSTELYGVKAAKGHTAFFLNGGDMLNISLSSYHNKGYDVIFLGYASISKHGEAKVKKFISDAAAYGIDVHIWMQCFYKEGGWSYPVDKAKGSYNETLLNQLVNEAKGYANMGVKGICFDYIRFPGGSGTRADDYNAGSVSGMGAINELCKRMNTALKAINPDIVLSACLMADSKDLSWNAKCYGQDATKMGRYIDVLCPMIYRNGSGFSTDDSKAYARNYADAAATASANYSRDCKCWGITDTYSGSQGLSASKIKSDVQDLASINHSNFTGVVLFRYGLGTFPDLSDLWK